MIRLRNIQIRAIIISHLFGIQHGQQIRDLLVRYSDSSTQHGEINFTLLGNSLATPVKEGGKEEVGNGIYGDYAVCEGPQSYYWVVHGSVQQQEQITLTL